MNKEKPYNFNNMTNKNLFYLTILKKIMTQMEMDNSKYSLRTFAKKLDISPATLSQVLSRKKGLSEKTANSIAKKLELSADDSKLFILSATAQHSRDRKTKVTASIELAEFIKKRSAHSKSSSNPNQIVNDTGPFLHETAEVQKLIQNSLIHQTYRYYLMNNGLQLRILHILKDKKSGKIIPDFIQITLNESTYHCAIVYFLKKENGRFKTYFNNILDGRHKVTSLVEENQNTEISFDSFHLPNIPHIYFLHLNANKYTVGQMIYTIDNFIVKGTLVNHEDPFANPHEKFILEFRRLK